MNKKIVVTISIIGVLIAVILNKFLPTFQEEQLNICINKIFTEFNNSTLQVKTENRKQFPTISGTATLDEKQKIFEKINQNCDLTEIQDFVQTQQIAQAEWLTFQIDDVNGVINLNGIVNSTQTLKNILSSFAYSYPEMSTTHDINVDKNFHSKDLDIHITLLLTAIEKIRVKNISIKNGNLTIKGIVRNKALEDSILLKLDNLFSEELTIVNQLDQLIELEVDNSAIKIEPLPIPQISPDT